MREPHRGLEAVVEDANVVMLLERRDDAAQHLRAYFLARLLDFHELEAARERGILLEVLLVLRPGRRRERAQLAARERRLEQVRGIVLTRRAARRRSWYAPHR